MMTNEERLEKIKETHEERIKQNEFYTASFIHVNWLIEQAEKVSWLEKEKNKQFDEFWEACVEVAGKDMAYEIVSAMPDDD